MAWPRDWHVLRRSPRRATFRGDRDEPLLRTFGGWKHNLVPDFSTHWQYGDVVLYAPKDPDLYDMAIMEFQGKSLDPHHASWTHVGIYVGDGEVCESVPDAGVGSRSLAEWFEDGEVRVRRLRGVSAAGQVRIMKDALTWCRVPYSFSKAALAASFNQLPDWMREKLKERELGDDAMYCAELVERAYVSAVDVSVRTDELPLVVPASYSMSPFFEEVDVGWRGVDSSAGSAGVLIR